MLMGDYSHNMFIEIPYIYILCIYIYTDVPPNVKMLAAQHIGTAIGEDWANRLASSLWELPGSLQDPPNGIWIESGLTSWRAWANYRTIQSMVYACQVLMSTGCQANALSPTTPRAPGDISRHKLV